MTNMTNMTTKPTVTQRTSTQPRVDKPAAAKTIPLWVDGLILLLMAGLVALVGGTVWQTGVFRFALTNDDRLSWHLVRSMGITAYTLLGASTVWGLFLSSKIIKDWSPGTLSLILHASVSWLAVVFTVAHMALLLVDTYIPYQVSDLIIPFTGPYRPFPVGLGTLAFWLILPIAISFSMRKVIGQRAWRLLHYFSYVSFGLVTAHALLAGTDTDKLGMRLLMFLFASAVVGLLTIRVGRARLPKTARAARQDSVTSY
ncbi:MAG: ferric reductase-like transmembrane domain-containing protein [Anaerolineae bacterium]|nr:ferric reductase-like transmembrane domain-containing protein [Anaerolineae bacterium]